MDLKVKIIMNIFRTYTLLNRIGLNLVEGTDLASVQQCQLLGIISRNKGITLSKLCEDTLVTKQNITGLVERMKKAGLITTWSDPTDKRVTRVGVTSKAEEEMKKMRPRTEMSNHFTFLDFSKEEIEVLDDMLERLVHSLRLQSNARKEEKQ